MTTDVDRCVCCGEPVPEGTWVCPNCAKKALGTTAPCKDCSKRYVGCHAKCPDYQSWSKIHSEGVRIRRQERTDEFEVFESLVKNKLRHKKRMRRRK